jgi:hypothetical protein
MWLVAKVLYPSFGVKRGFAQYQLASTVPSLPVDVLSLAR